MIRSAMNDIPEDRWEAAFGKRDIFHGLPSEDILGIIETSPNATAEDLSVVKMLKEGRAFNKTRLLFLCETCSCCESGELKSVGIHRCDNCNRVVNTATDKYYHDYR